MKKLLLLLALLFISVTVSFTEEIPEEDGVLLLSNSNFEQAIQENEDILVAFIHPSMQDRKSFDKEYARAAFQLIDEESLIRLAQVDSKDEPDLAAKFDVKEYPTLKLFRKGTPIQYKGGIAQRKIVDWLKKKTQPPVVQLDKTQDVDSLFGSFNAATVFWGDKSHAKWKIFESIAQKFDEVLFFHSSESEHKSKYGAGAADIATIFGKLENLRTHYSGDFDGETFHKLLEDHQEPPIVTFNRAYSDNFFTGNNEALLLLYREDDAAGKEALTAFRAITSLKNKIALTKLDIDKGANGEGPILAQYMGLLRAQLPKFVILKNEGSNPTKYIYTGDITPEGLKQFYNDYREQKVEPAKYFKSTIPPAQQEGLIHEVVGETFEEIVLDDTKDVLLEYYAPWCGHCKAFIPTYEGVAERVKDVENLVIAKIDGDGNKITGSGIEGFPTLVLYRGGDKKNPLVYNDRRTIGEVWIWLMKNTKVAKWPTEDL